MMDVEKIFLDAISGELGVLVNILAYRDWLEEIGRTIDAKGVEDTLNFPTPKRVEDLCGKVCSRVVRKDNLIVFTLVDGTVCKLVPSDDCNCGNDVGVWIESIDGDLQDLEGSVIILAEENTNSDDPAIDDRDSHTWTFYRFATIKGYVTIRWYGSSNGYYSEKAEFYVEDLKPRV